MEIYFIAIQVTPLPENPLVARVESALVYFWIADASAEAANERATTYLASYRWKIESIEKGPVETTAADFADQEEGLKGFWKAKQKGLAAHFVGKPRPGARDTQEPGSNLT